MHTSYWKKYGGGYKNKNSFIEYSKNFIDKINAWHSRTDELPVTNFTKTAKSLHYYDSILVIEKSPIAKPKCSKTGTDIIPTYKRNKKTKNDAKPIKNTFKNKVLGLVAKQLKK